ncbi:hypothetical protein NDU88_001593 [Pleurodeles waltl]|uniref:Uncharacterized protein n=1 Tax=Pleurodeles waltl TaxID=8319 RepID=A0AAV7SZN9_PLEWA|nr:hypothetical protein NDU88_001593 [Pleurodeles waltl]
MSACVSLLPVTCLLSACLAPGATYLSLALLPSALYSLLIACPRSVNLPVLCLPGAWRPSYAWSYTPLSGSPPTQVRIPQKHCDPVVFSAESGGCDSEEKRGTDSGQLVALSRGENWNWRIGDFGMAGKIVQMYMELRAHRVEQWIRKQGMSTGIMKVEAGHAGAWSAEGAKQSEKIYVSVQ